MALKASLFTTDNGLHGASYATDEMV